MRFCRRTVTVDPGHVLGRRVLEDRKVAAGPTGDAAMARAIGATIEPRFEDEFLSDAEADLFEAGLEIQAAQLIEIDPTPESLAAFLGYSTPGMSTPYIARDLDR